ncbi:MAG TPA: hypothetical protein PK177_17590, partial [Burkholderiaceae bacterium]|nr:hypothetical protein [Burkholderiaceae bacterium]
FALSLADDVTGLARGLLQYWGSLPEIRSAGSDRQAAVAAAAHRVQRARAAGWVVLRRMSPTRGSFADWGEPAIDDYGRPVPGSLVIPNDSLIHAEQRSPSGGAGGTHLGLPVGRASGQTLLDANLLKIEVVYGVPMTVPLIGRIAARVGRLAGGCLSAERGGCAVFEAPDASGRSIPRWPVAAVATMRMQSPALLLAETPSRPAGGPGTGAGEPGAGGPGAGGPGAGGPGAGGATDGPASVPPPGTSPASSPVPTVGTVDEPGAFRPASGGSLAIGDVFGGIAAPEDGSLARAGSN